MRKLRRREASRYLQERYGISAKPATLAKYATLGGGPIFRRAGRFPVYDMQDLDDWAESRLSPPVRSTSELAVTGTRRETEVKPSSRES